MAIGAARGGRARDPDALPTRTKLLYGLGDHAVNLTLSSLLFIFPNFLTDVAGLRPALAGLIPLIGRSIDAMTDPAMGRISDRSRFRLGRRRPWLLIGFVPFGVFFAALWAGPRHAPEALRFGWYAGAYVLFAVSVTVLSVPYMALIPELTHGYQERTSLNAWRAAMAILGTLLAVTAFPMLARTFGGGPAGYRIAGMIGGVWVALPWLLVFKATFERPEHGEPAPESFFQGLVSQVRHHSFRRLVGLFLLSRMAIDLASTMLLYFFAYWLGRRGDFSITMGLFLAVVVCAYPLWVRIGERRDKRTVFLFGALAWIAAQVFLWLVTPGWPRWLVFAVAAFAGVGYAAADMIPWSMLAEVVDEDELRCGERREGLYFGSFTFLRKLGGAGGVSLALFVLGLSGFHANQAQGAPTLLTIRVLTAVVPGVFVALAAVVALGYPIGRARHEEIRAALHARRSAA